MCARATIIERAATNTPLGRMHVSWISADSASTVSHRTPSIRTRELSRFCTTLTTSGKRFDSTSTRKIPGCPHSIWHISLVVKVGKFIHLQTVGEILQSSGRVQISRPTQSAGIKPPSVSCDLSLSCVSHQQTTLSYMEDSFDASCSCSDFLDTYTCSLELLE